MRGGSHTRFHLRLLANLRLDLPADNLTSPTRTGIIMSAFTCQIKTRFNHTDPAGIVFYPRYYEMLNHVIEDWFEDGLHWPFHHISNGKHFAFPMVKLETQFIRPTPLGERLTFALLVTEIGQSSLKLHVTATGEDQTMRIIFYAVMVMAEITDGKDRTTKAVSLPAALQKKARSFLKPDSTNHNR